MNFTDRSFAGQFFRPKPLLIHNEVQNAFIILSSWGQKSEEEKVSRFFLDSLQREENSEMTSPFGNIKSLSARANQLRTAAMLSNDYLYREVNGSEYLASIEVLALVYEKEVLSWVQVGSPQLLISFDGIMQPLAYTLDLSWQLGQKAPLASQALGLESSCHPNCGSTVLKSNSDLVLISRGQIPPKIFQIEKINLETLSQVLVDDNPDIPFWLGHISLSSSLT